MALEVLSDDEAPHVAFTGSSGTGKTTLAKWLAKELDVPFNPIGARSVAVDMGFVDEKGEARPYDVDNASLKTYLHYAPNLQESTPEQRILAARASRGSGRDQQSPTCRVLFQQEVQRQKILWEVNHWRSGFVTDRSSIDDLTYCCLHGIRGIQEGYLDRALEHAAKYSTIFMTPLGAFLSLEADGARVPDRTYRRIFETLLEGFLFSVPHLDINGLLWHLTMSDLDERKTYIKQTLK